MRVTIADAPRLKSLAVRPHRPLDSSRQLPRIERRRNGRGSAAVTDSRSSASLAEQFWRNAEPTFCGARPNAFLAPAFAPDVPVRRLVDRPGEVDGQSLGALRLARHFLANGLQPPTDAADDARIAVDRVLAAGVARNLSHGSFDVRRWLTVEVATSRCAIERTEYGAWLTSNGWDDSSASLKSDAVVWLSFGATPGVWYIDVRAVSELLQRLHPRGADLLIATLNDVDDHLYPVMTPWRLFDLASSAMWLDCYDDGEFLLQAEPDVTGLSDAAQRSPSEILDYLGWEGPSSFVRDHPVWALQPGLRARLLQTDPRQSDLTTSAEPEVTGDEALDHVLDDCLRTSLPCEVRILLDQLLVLRAALTRRRQDQDRATIRIRSYFPAAGIFLQACSEARLQHVLDECYRDQMEGEGITSFFAEMGIAIDGAAEIERVESTLRQYVDDLALLAKVSEALQLFPSINDDHPG